MKKASKAQAKVIAACFVGNGPCISATRKLRAVLSTLIRDGLIVPDVTPKEYALGGSYVVYTYSEAGLNALCQYLLELTRFRGHFIL